MQPTDQLGRPMHDLRISVTDHCNFRCTYCMPAAVFHEKYAFLPTAKLLTFDEIARLARIGTGLGVRKLRLTGGEPLVRPGVERLVSLLAAIDGVDDIAMTTNAYYLSRLAPALRAAGLRRLTISLDTLDDAVFFAMNGGRAHVADVLAGIAAAEAAGFAPIKINAVVQRGVNEHTLVDLARFARERGHILRLIEYMDVGTRNGWNAEHVVPAREIAARIDAVFPLEPMPRTYASEVALRYRYRDGGGEIGLIASVTMPFCGACARLRLSADGQVYTCLFAQTGTSLRDPMRAGADDAALTALLAGVWRARTDRYSEIRSEATAAAKKIEMYYIGG
jgi:cyclic pyranopterin phosphate synthase